MSVVFQSFFFLLLRVLWTTSQCTSGLPESSRTPFTHDPFMNTSSCKSSFSTWGYFCTIMHGGGIKTVEATVSPFQCTCRDQVANDVQVWHATGRPAWPPTHVGEWGGCVRSTVSNGEHLWPLGCGDRGQWWPQGSRRALARAAKARHRLGSQPYTHMQTHADTEGWEPMLEEKQAATTHELIAIPKRHWNKLYLKISQIYLQLTTKPM